MDAELSGFEGVGLIALNEVAFLQRFDTKFLMASQTLHSLLEALQDQYAILEIEGCRIFQYDSVYYDTAACSLYHKHRRGMEGRQKVRIRHYLDSGLCYLEVKTKRKGKTDKQRLRRQTAEFNFSVNEEAFLSDLGLNASELSPYLRTTFSRITLKNLTVPERATFDVGVQMLHLQNGKRMSLGALCIGEMKRDRSAGHTALWHMLKNSGIRPTGFSKYSIGMALTQPQLPSNTFKPVLLRLPKYATLHHA